MKNSHEIDNHNRNIGLDICRTIAILVVVFGHALNHSNPNETLKSLSFIGMFGVDLFFCLSGFLIGRILIDSSKTWKLDPQAGLWNFLYRRWMRTLPLYFFFLLVWLKWDWQGSTTLSEQLPYLVFAQNLAWPMTDFYLLTWSLAVEEWFYFLFPLLVLSYIAFSERTDRGVIFAIVALILVPFFLRIWVPEYITGAIAFDEGVRHIVVYRLDAIGFGVGIAYVFAYHRSVFDRIGSFWGVIFIPLATIILMPKLGYPYFSESNIGMSIYLTLSALLFALIIPFFNSINIKKNSNIVKIIKLTSAISYSIYLGHIIAFIFVIRALKWLNIYDFIYVNPWLLYPIFLVSTYILAVITYHIIERPFLLLRDRI